MKKKVRNDLVNSNLTYEDTSRPWVEELHVTV